MTQNVPQEGKSFHGQISSPRLSSAAAGEGLALVAFTRLPSTNFSHLFWARGACQQTRAFRRISISELPDFKLRCQETQVGIRLSGVPHSKARTSSLWCQ